MFKAKHKMRSILLVCLAMLATVILGLGSLFSMPQTTARAAEATETLNIIATQGTVNGKSISWSSEHFTFTNNQGSSSTAIRTSDDDHYRVYQNSNGSITSNNSEIITKVVITCTSSSYATACKNSFGNIATVSSSTVTITPAAGATSVEFTKATAQWRLKTVVITYTEAASCDHSGTEESWAYDSENKEHYKQCTLCENEIEGTREECSNFNYSDYTTENGVHTRTATCTVCNGVQTESGACEIAEGEFERKGNTHTQTGTCGVCNASTSVTENCTLSYENVSNDNKTHNTTSTCSVCQQSVTTENVACTFESSAVGAIVTYTCTYCEYSYTEEATTYTVTYAVPNGVTAPETVEVVEDFTTTLPAAETIEGYTFVGWATKEVEKTEESPDFFAAETEYTVTADVTLYALYSYAEGTGAYTLVKDATTLAAGKEIVIVASDSNYALGADKGNNRNAATITKSGDTVEIDETVQIITLEAGTVDNTFAFNVGGYLYAASSSSNYLKTKTTLDNNGSWLITITNSGVATIKAQGTNTRNWLRKNSSSALFACYSSGQNDVSIYMKDGATYYVTTFNTCTHTNTNEVIEEATCTESGSRTVTCLDCESEIESEILPALGHNYVDGICANEGCGKQDPASIVYDGYYYLILNNKYLDTTTLDNSNRYKPVDFTPGETVEAKYVFHFTKTNDTYTISELTNGVYMEDVTIVTNNDYSVNLYNKEGNILSHNATANYVGFYKTTNSYARDFIFVPVELPANIDSASLTVKQDIAVNYYITIDENFAGAKLEYEYNSANGVMKDEITGEIQQDGRYKFSLGLAPQLMTEMITTKLVYNGLVLDTNEYSIQTYAQNQLNKIADGDLADDGLKQLLTDMLYYGAAAQKYTGYKANEEQLVTYGVENLGEASTEMPPEIKAKPVNNPDVTSYSAYFTGANVWFDSTNKVMVKISTTENVKLMINGEETEITGTTIYTDELLPTEFNKEFKFELYYGSTLMQTLTYSVNAYAYKMKDNAEMSELALALYRYGLSASNYTA